MARLASGSTRTSAVCEAAIGPAWKAFWARNTERQPADGEGVGLPVHRERAVQSPATMSPTDLMSAAVKANPTAPAAPNMAARHHRGPRRARSTVTHHHPAADGAGRRSTRALVGASSPAVGLGEDEESGQPAGGGERTRSTPGDAIAEPEPGGQEEHEEQELGGQDGLDLAEVTEVEGDRLAQERPHHDGESDQPDPALEGVGHQAQAGASSPRGRPRRPSAGGCW